jgi:hypothetical protein
MDFGNSTDLDGARLQGLFVRHAWPYRHDCLAVHVRYSRGADFSGTCFYAHARIYVNLGRRNIYPYLLATQVARSRSNRTHWWREMYRLVVADAYQLALFVFLHELYHYLVKLAGRSPRRKEAMCDRFAARALVDDYGVRVLDARGRPVARERWDFQDLDGLVAAAPKVGVQGMLFAGAGPREIPVAIGGVRAGRSRRRDASSCKRRDPRTRCARRGGPWPRAAP